MVDGIKTAFKDNLPHLDWMDEATRALAQEKVSFEIITNEGPCCHSAITFGNEFLFSVTYQAENVADLIAFPDFLIDPAKLDEKYDGLELKENAYLANSIKASHWKLTQLMKKLNVTPDRQEWEMSPLWVSRYLNLFTVFFPINDVAFFRPSAEGGGAIIGETRSFFQRPAELGQLSERGYYSRKAFIGENTVLWMIVSLARMNFCRAESLMPSDLNSAGERDV